MKKWYLFDESGNEMCTGDDWDNFDKAQYVYVSLENIAEFRKHYDKMGFDAQNQIISNKVNEWDSNVCEFVECYDAVIIKKIMSFLEEEKAKESENANVVKMECAAKVGVKLKEDSEKKANLILYFKGGNSIQTNEKPTDINELLNAIQVLLNPSILGNKIESIKIEING